MIYAVRAFRVLQGRKRFQGRMRRDQSAQHGLGDCRLYRLEGLHLRADPVLLLQLRVDSGVLQPGVSR